MKTPSTRKRNANRNPTSFFLRPDRTAQTTPINSQTISKMVRMCMRRVYSEARRQSARVLRPNYDSERLINNAELQVRLRDLDDDISAVFVWTGLALVVVT